MNERDWHILLTVFETRSVTGAAEKLFTSQPALSYRLKRLEERFDVRLFERDGRKLNFTQEGEHLVDHARRMLREDLRMREELTRMQQHPHGEIRLGVSSNYAAYRLPPLLAAFQARHGGASFSLTSGLSHELFVQLQHEEIHLALVRDSFNWKERKFVVDEDPFYVFSREAINFDDLPRLPQIALDTSTFQNRLVADWWNARFSEPPRVAMSVDKIEACMAMVRHGLGYTIVSSIALQETDRLFRYPIVQADGQQLTNKTWLLYRKQSERLPLVEKLIDMLKRRMA
ncbi:hypothetical protein BTW08_07470 [Salinicola sp. MH3R3-1]|uniref:LysR family transcriptional regulator n=1 Tax=Salinicola sp. MH3R3-1 TaxID=1928762 RepID=UPI00094ED1A8|nr:LysR family transcriptional regulator [Salinicola sp. MH3R3-1]OLO08367.1 hypothetical protein BTW08_07470 [Salinicola sp. MH3R3-1]